MGIDRAVFYFLLGKAFSFISAPLTLYFVARFLSSVEQGYYYTFYSLLGLSIFFELGLGIVITQFASHEYANLSWDSQGGLKGESKSLSRLISLLRKSMKWYAIIVGLFIIFVLPGGWLFLNSKQESSGINFTLPWVILIISFGISTCFIPFLSCLEGCGKVEDVQRLRLIQVVVGVLCSWLVLINRGKLMAPAVEFLAYWNVIFLFLIFKYKGFIRQFLTYRLKNEVSISWFKEVFPMQWRIAVSWLSAYFTGYLFVPLLFAYRGPIEAGKMGMSLKLSGIVYTFSMAWINTRVPFYGALIQKKRYRELDKLALKSSLQALLAGIILSLFIIGGLGILERYFPQYSNRILPRFVIGVLCIANLINVVNSAIGGYLRAHKEEPLMVISIIVAISVAGVTFISAKYYNATVMAILYTLVMMCIAFPGFWLILIKKRHQWHNIKK